MNIDFSQTECRDALAEARKHIIEGYKILRDEVGADNPADNGFIREAAICACQRLVWVGERGGTDAKTPDGKCEVEIKSTRLDKRPVIQFGTSRYVSPVVIQRFRAADWFLFGIFDLYEELIALYKVDKAAMNPMIGVLDTEMQTRMAANRQLQNNPKFKFTEIQPVATRVFLSPNYVEEQHARRGWTITPKSP